MEMSSAPDIRRRPHRSIWAPGGKRFGKWLVFFQEGQIGYGKKFLNI
jgi:hypothetical protein